MVRQAGKKLITEGAKKVVTAVRGRGRPKGSTNKPKTVKRSEAPIQSERNKITAANATAANTRQSKSIANKAFGANAAGGAGTTAVKKASTGASRPGRGVAATSIAGGAALTLMNKKGSSAPAKVTFADAFREARAKGEGTKFTHDGKPYVAVTKTDLKKKGYDDNELGAYNKRGGKARGPLNRLGQGVKKVLLGKDKKFGGDKGAIDFIRKPVKKAAGGMMSPQPFTSQKPPGAIIDPPKPMPPRPPMPRREPKPRTQLIDPRLPRGKVGKGPLEPRDSTTRVPAERSGLAGILKKRMAAQAMNPPKLKKGPNDGRGGGGQPPFTPKLPGAKDGGMMKTKGYKAGGSVKTKACGVAKRGYGKAYMKGKR
jgi:hypothetical protein